MLLPGKCLEEEKKSPSFGFIGAKRFYGLSLVDYCLPYCWYNTTKLWEDQSHYLGIWTSFFSFVNIFYLMTLQSADAFSHTVLLVQVH